MRRLLYILALHALLSLTACSDDKPAVDNGAVDAAKEYYDSLFAGNSAYFVRGMYLPDTIPANYRRQLEAGAKMFVRRMNDEHNGVYEVRAFNCETDTVRTADGKMIGRTANAFLVLCFGDSLNEEVVVPMIEHKGRWVMR